MLYGLYCYIDIQPDIALPSLTDSCHDPMRIIIISERKPMTHDVFHIPEPCVNIPIGIRPLHLKTHLTRRVREEVAVEGRRRLAEWRGGWYTLDQKIKSVARPTAPSTRCQKLSHGPGSTIKAPGHRIVPPQAFFWCKLILITITIGIRKEQSHLRANRWIGCTRSGHLRSWGISRIRSQVAT